MLPFLHVFFLFYERDSRYLLENVLTKKHSYKDSSEPSRQSFSPSQSLVNNRALLICNKNIINIFNLSELTANSQYVRRDRCRQGKAERRLKVEKGG